MSGSMDYLLMSDDEYGASLGRAGGIGRRPRLAGGQDYGGRSSPQAQALGAGVLDMLMPPSPQQYLATQDGYSMPRGAETRMLDSGLQFRVPGGDWRDAEPAMNLERLGMLALPSVGGAAPEGALRAGAGRVVRRQASALPARRGGTIGVQPAEAAPGPLPSPPPTSARPAATMTPEEAMDIATAPRPGAGVPLLEGDALTEANELSQRVLDFRRQQMTIKQPSRRVQALPEDQLFAPAQFDQHVPGAPQGGAARDLDALRIENIAPTQTLPGSRAQAGNVGDMAANYGSTYDYIVEELDPIARIMRGERVDNATAQQIASAGSGAFYNMRPVYDRLIADGFEPQDALRRLMQEAQGIAGTSPRTKTTQNVINSGFLQNRMARGLPVDEASVQAAAGPGSGYGMIYNQHPALTENMLTGRATLGENPKPDIFARNIAGDRSATTADVHNVRAINMLYNDRNPGGLPASAFENVEGYQRYLAAYRGGHNGGPPVGSMPDAELRELLVARPSGQGVRNNDISTEYPVYHDITAEVGRRTGLSPADAQALMWFHYGPRTGLESTAHTVPELLNQRLSVTAQGLGIPQTEAARLYWRNKIPLAGAAGAAGLPSLMHGGDEER